MYCSTFALFSSLRGIFCDQRSSSATLDTCEPNYILREPSLHDLSVAIVGADVGFAPGWSTTPKSLIMKTMEAVACRKV